MKKKLLVFLFSLAPLMGVSCNSSPIATTRQVAPPEVSVAAPTELPVEIPAADSAPVAEALARISAQARRYHEHVTILASPWLSGRLPGTPGIEVAEKYIAYWFDEFGLSPGIKDGEPSFFQSYVHATRRGAAHHRP